MRELSEPGSFAACVLNRSREPFVAWLRDGTLLTVNLPFEKLTGYASYELEEMKWPHDFAIPETGDMIKETMDSPDRGNETPLHQGVLLRKDGSRAEIMTSVHRFNPAGNGEPYYFSFVTDVTERKTEQMALQEAKALAELFLDLMSNDIDNMNRVSIRYLELALGTARLRPGERELIMTALGSLMNSSRMIGNVRRVQDRPDFP